MTKKGIPRPVFVKGDLRFHLQGVDYFFKNKNISLFGVTGLRWPGPTIDTVLGEKLLVETRLHTNPLYNFSCTARLMNELTAKDQIGGVRFELTAEQTRRLGEIIDRQGHPPSEYERKFPRIPALPEMPRMPLHAVCSLGKKDLHVFSIANVSPSGVLLFSENPQAALITPGEKFHVHIEARGESFLDFNFTGLVARVLQSRNPRSHNVETYIGVRFAHFDAFEKAKFVELLSTILHDLRTA